MKKVMLTLVIGLMTMVGFGQVVVVKTTKRQDFEHPSEVSTDYAANNGLLVYKNGGSVDGSFIFDLDNMVLKLTFNKSEIKESTPYKIVKRFEGSTPVNVIVESNGIQYFFVLAKTIKDDSYVLVCNEIIGKKTIGEFYPDSEVEVIKK